jgi:hypothetical protein
VQVNRGAAGVASTHPGALQDVKSVLPLREKKTIVTAGDGDTK